MQASEFARLLNARRNGRGQWIARCPAHVDKKPSLHIKEGKSWVLVTCWSQQCSTESIVDAMGLKMSDLAYNESIRQDPKIMAAAKRAAYEHERDEYRKRIHDWIKFFRENGYSDDDYERDKNLAIAAAEVCGMEERKTEHWKGILRVCMERIIASSFVKRTPPKEETPWI